MGYRWVEHTADVELEIEAATIESVFTEALHALAELIGDGAGGESVSQDVHRGVPRIATPVLSR